jgi:hypothetical protein
MVQVLSLANTGEPLFVVNRPGSRPSHEQAFRYFDRAVAQVTHLEAIFRISGRSIDRKY